MRLIGVGDIYADPHELRASSKLIHPELPAAVRGRLQRIAATFAEAQPKSVEEWERGFRCDMHPWREIAIWERMVDAYRHFASHLPGDDDMSKQKRRDVFAVVLQWSNCDQDHGRRRMSSVGTVTQRRANEIGDWMFSKPNNDTLKSRQRELRNLICESLPGPARLPLEALIGEDGGPNRAAHFDPWELVDAADVIFAVDIDTEDEVPVFGRDFLESVSAGGAAVPARVLHVEIDQDTEDLERLLGIVVAVKGRHDYPTGDDQD
jgi:hypothetical protein